MLAALRAEGQDDLDLTEVEARPASCEASGVVAAAGSHSGMEFERLRQCLGASGLQGRGLLLMDGGKAPRSQVSHCCSPNLTIRWRLT